jgi:hypothetical protein
LFDFRTFSILFHNSLSFFNSLQDLLFTWHEAPQSRSRWPHNLP